MLYSSRQDFLNDFFFVVSEWVAGLTAFDGRRPAAQEPFCMAILRSVSFLSCPLPLAVLLFFRQITSPFLSTAINDLE